MEWHSQPCASKYVQQTGPKMYTALQSQEAESAHITIKQMLVYFFTGTSKIET